MHRRKYYLDRRERFLPGGVPFYVRCYDNGGETGDRYTVVYAKKSFDGWFHYRAMSENPFHPQGVGIYGETQFRPVDVTDNSGWPPAMGRKCHLGTRIPFEELPEKCRELVLRDYSLIWDLCPHDRHGNPLPLPEK
ncbi:MAG: hypothetical protein ACK4S4_15585 [Pyrinomonadaceae bacterium]